MQSNSDSPLISSAMRLPKSVLALAAAWAAFYGATRRMRAGSRAIAGA
jgi:hypothetical protein